MNLQQIKDAVESGKVVCWSSPAYVVAKDATGQWLIVCLHNGSAIGLTWRDGVTLNGKTEEFFIREDQPS